MDRRESRKNSIRTQTQFVIKSHQFLKKLIRFLLSISVFFSLFFSHNFCFSRFTFQLFTHSIDKNYIFLICNGLLVFVAKYSGLISSCSSKSSFTNNNNTVDYGSFNDYEDVSSPESSVQRQSDESLLGEEVIEREDDGMLENVSSLEEMENKFCTIQEKEEEEKEEREARELVEEENEDEHGESIRFTTTTEEERGQLYLEQEEEMLLHVEYNSFFHQEPEVEEEREAEREYQEEEMDQFGEGNNGILTAEELNKKFDEFIRKMKAELRIEARRRLIVI